MNNNFLKNAYYLMIKNGFYNEALDEALLNLVLIVIKNKHYDRIDCIDELVKDFQNKIGFELPYFPMQTILLLAKKRDYLLDGSKKGEFIPNYSKISKINSGKEIASRENSLRELKNSFYEFLKVNAPGDSYDENKVEEMIDSFIETQGALFYLDKQSYFSSAHENFLFAKFICEPSNIKYYELIDELIAGRILSELLVHDDKNIELESSCFKNTNVYLDAGLIFILLDIDELNRGESYRKLISDMQDLGIKIKVFRHTFVEVENIISNSIQWINNHDFDPALSSKTAYYFVTNAYTVEDIEEKLSNMIIELDGLGIIIDDVDYPTDLEGCKYYEQDYYEAIKDYYIEKNILFDEDEKRETIENDAKSFFYVSVKNNFIPSFQLNDVRNVLLTNNTSLAIIAKMNFGKPKNIPFCVTDTFFGALIWKSNPKILELPSKQKLSNFIYQAFSPTDAMFEKFSKVITESFEEQKITDEECIVLRQNKSAAKLLVEVTAGDIEKINIDTPHDIMKRIKDAATEAGRKEAYEKSNLIIKEKDDIINKQKASNKDAIVERYSSDIRNKKAYLKLLKENYAGLKHENDIAHEQTKKYMNKVGVACLAALIVLIVLFVSLFILGIKKGIDYLSIISAILTAIGLLSSPILLAFKNEEYTAIKVIQKLRENKMKDYCEKHNCSDEILKAKENEINEVENEINILEKELDDFYF